MYNVKNFIDTRVKIIQGVSLIFVASPSEKSQGAKYIPIVSHLLNTDPSSTFFISRFFQDFLKSLLIRPHCTLTELLCEEQKKKIVKCRLEFPTTFT